MRRTDIEPDPRPLRIIAACIVLPWLLVALAVAYVAHGAESQRLDVNGEPLAYNAPCSTDTDCMQRFGR